MFHMFQPPKVFRSTCPHEKLPRKWMSYTKLFPRFEQKSPSPPPSPPSPNGVCQSPPGGRDCWGPKPRREFSLGSCRTPRMGRFLNLDPWTWMTQGFAKHLSKLKSQALETLVWYFSKRWWQLKHFFIFTPDPWGRWTHFDEHIFQMGWFNHQPVFVLQDLRVV